MDRQIGLENIGQRNTIQNTTEKVPVPGPQPLTIEQYKSRQTTTLKEKQRAKARDDRLTAIPQTPPAPKRRGGIRAKAQRRRYIIISILKEGTTTIENQQRLESELRSLNSKLHRKNQ